MEFRKLSMVGVLPGAVFAAALAASPAAASTDKSCVFEKYSPSAVQPYHVEEHLGYDTYTMLKGAKLFIPAQEGLTKEWLEHSVQQAFRSEHACKPDAHLSQISVSSAGNGFWLHLGSHGPKEAKELLRWAEKLVQQKGASAGTASAK